MNVKIYPCTLNGDVKAPSSKSAAHRAFIAAALGDRKCSVLLSSSSKDIETTVSCLNALGAKIEKQGGVYEVTPVTAPQNAVFDCGESGSTLRFMLPVAAALGAGGTFVGGGRLPERPMKELTDVLAGCAVSSDKLPISLSGRLKGGVFRLRGDISSQFVSGLLFALPLVGGEIALTTPLESASYVELTARVLRDFGVEVLKTENGYKTRGEYRSPTSCEVEGDWSNAAFFIAASAIGNFVRVTGLSPDSAQGDAAVKKLLLSFRSGGTDINAADVPDLVPVLSVAAA